MWYLQIFGITQIVTTADFMQISVSSDTSFILMNDLDFANVDYTPQSFQGTFEGNQHTIKNINIYSPLVQNYLQFGVFSYSCHNVIIQNLILSNIQIEVRTFALSPTINLVIGLLSAGGENIQIINVDAQGEIMVNAVQDVIDIGLIGRSADFSAQRIRTSIKVTLIRNPFVIHRRIAIGGLIGFAAKATMMTSSSTFNLITKHIGDFGGYVGQSNSVTVNQLEATVTSTTPSTGGIAGYALQIVANDIKVLAKSPISSVVSESPDAVCDHLVVDDDVSTIVGHGLITCNFCYVKTSKSQSGFTALIDQPLAQTQYDTFNFASIWQVVASDYQNTTSTTAFLSVFSYNCPISFSTADRSCFPDYCVIDGMVCGGKVNLCNLITKRCDDDGIVCTIDTTPDVPVDPVDPNNPVTPIVPLIPTLPTIAISPVYPVDAIAAVDPIDPSITPDPQNPVVPIYPMLPTGPSQSIPAVTPLDPVIPIPPVAPDIPSDNKSTTIIIVAALALGLSAGAVATVAVLRKKKLLNQKLKQALKPVKTGLPDDGIPSLDDMHQDMTKLGNEPIPSLQDTQRSLSKLPKIDNILVSATISDTNSKIRRLKNGLTEIDPTQPGEDPPLISPLKSTISNNIPMARYKRALNKLDGDEPPPEGDPSGPQSIYDDNGQMRRRPVGLRLNERPGQPDYPGMQGPPQQAPLQELGDDTMRMVRRGNELIESLNGPPVVLPNREEIIKSALDEESSQLKRMKRSLNSQLRSGDQSLVSSDLRDVSGDNVDGLGDDQGKMGKRAIQLKLHERTKIKPEDDIKPKKNVDVDEVQQLKSNILNTRQLDREKPEDEPDNQPGKKKKILKKRKKGQLTETIQKLPDDVQQIQRRESEDIERNKVITLQQLRDAPDANLHLIRREATGLKPINRRRSSVDGGDGM